MRPWTVARMTPSASTSSGPPIAMRASASVGPRQAPTSTAITVRLLRPRGAARPRGLDECVRERRVAAVHPRLARDGAVAEPRGAQGARVARFGDAILLHDDGDVVAGAPAAEAGDVLDAPLLDAHAVLAFGASMA